MLLNPCVVSILAIMVLLLIGHYLNTRVAEGESILLTLSGRASFVVDVFSIA